MSSRLPVEQYYMIRASYGLTPVRWTSGSDALSWAVNTCPQSWSPSLRNADRHPPESARLTSFQFGINGLWAGEVVSNDLYRGAKTVDSFFQPERFPVSPESPCQRTLCNRLSFDPIASAIIAVTKLLILTPSVSACLFNFE